MKYMLDTNICIYAVKKKFLSLQKNMTAHYSEGICISSIVKAEIEYGISKSAFPEKNRLAFETFSKDFSVENFDESAAGEYGKIRARLEKLGTPIGGNDLFIAAHCRALNHILITHNLKEFERVENLKLEDWTIGAEE